MRPGVHRALPLQGPISQLPGTIVIHFHGFEYRLPHFH